MAKPLQKFARVNLDRFERLCAEVAALDSAESVHEGEALAARVAGDQRTTSFSGWSLGKSARDCRNRLQFAMRQAAQARGRAVAPLRLVFIEEKEFYALCAKPRLREDLARLELEQQPIPGGEQPAKREERQELLRLVADAAIIEQRIRERTAQQPLRLLRQETPLEEEDGTVCACLSRAYVLVRPVGLLEGEPLVSQPDHREIRARVVAQMETEAQRPPRRHHGRRIWRAPKEQLALLKEAKG